MIQLSIVWGQSKLEEGFTLLDQGKYQEAEAHFGEIISIEPNHITANICYGRAMGLGGQAAEANQHFEAMYEKHPEHFEISLNLAESYMWDQHPKEALKIYQILYTSNPDHFVVNLGMANTYSELSDPATALSYITKARQIDPPNESAQISEKYIRLAYSQVLSNKNKFQDAQTQIDKILINYLDDKDALLSRANLYLKAKDNKAADNVYLDIVNKAVDTLEGYLGLSYTRTLLNKKKEALAFAKQAYEYSNSKNVIKENKVRSTINLINALGINQKFKEGFNLIHEGQSIYSDEEKFILAEARLQFWNRQYKDAHKTYASVDSTDKGFEYHMGATELYRSMKNYEIAEQEIKEALIKNPNQADAIQLMHDVKMDRQPRIKGSHIMSMDNGNNEAQESTLEVQLLQRKKLTPSMTYLLRRASNSVTGENANQHQAVLGLRYQTNFRLGWLIEGGFTSNSIEDDKTQNNLVYNTESQIHLGKYHNLSLGLKKYYQNYTAGLIQSNLATADYRATYNYAHPKLPGLFLQYIYSDMSDTNKRNLLYASIYKNLTSYPSLKLGINYLVLGFDQNKEALYFSPDEYQNAEIFAQLSTTRIRPRKGYYDAFIAVGQQQISDEDSQLSVRTNLTLGYKFNHYLSLEGKYTYSTTAQSTAAGYTHHSVGVSIIYTLPPE